MALVKILGANLQSKSGDVATASIQVAGGVVGIYFSAHWCPPCRAFTPELVTFYEKVKATANGQKFEIVFVSFDRNQGAFDEYYATMPWMTVPYTSNLREGLGDSYGVSGIPSFLLLDAETGAVITKDGRNIVTSDKDGQKFPWK